MIRHLLRRPDPDAPPAPPVPGLDGRLDPAACFRYCEAVARAHHHNFPVASVFLPAALRPHVFALYAFVRACDDFADEPAYEGRRLEELAAWEDRLVALFHDGTAEHPVFVALGETIARYDLPISPLRDLCAAFRMDLGVRRYATFDDLGAYLSLAADPIGRLLLYVFGVRDPSAHGHADALSRALALTGFWQDFADDLGRDRLYVPVEDLRHFGVSDEDLAARRPSRRLADLLAYQCARTRALYLRARPLLERVGDDLGVEVSLFWQGGLRVLEKIEARLDDPFGPRVRLGTADKAVLVARAVASARRGRR
jgi:hydroxysqualene synthase